MPLKLTNNATSKLSSALPANVTTLSVMPGDGAKFPVLAPGDWFPMTLTKADGTIEILRCTERVNDTFVVMRAQDGTAMHSWSAGDRVELRMTAAAAAEFKQRGEISSFMNNTLLPQGDAENARNALGLASASTRDIVQTNIDTQPGRLPVVGWLGLGGNAPGIGNTINEPRPGGSITTVWAGDTNRPSGMPAEASGTLHTAINYYGEWLNQLLIADGIGDAWLRSIKADQSLATSWGRVITSLNIGSQSVSHAETAGSASTLSNPITINGTQVNAGSNITINPTTAQVANATAGIYYADTIGAYAFLANVSGATVGHGDVLAGSLLRFAGTHSGTNGPVPAGSWRCMGLVPHLEASVFLRVA